jgi:hypothetical protein
MLTARFPVNPAVLVPELDGDGHGDAWACPS